MNHSTIINNSSTNIMKKYFKSNEYLSRKRQNSYSQTQLILTRVNNQ